MVHRTLVLVQELVEAEVLAAVGLHVVFLQSPLDHLGRVVLGGQLQEGVHTHHTMTQ